MNGKRKRIGEMLLDAGLIDENQLSAAIGDQRQWGGRLCSVLVRFGFVSERTVAAFLEKQLGEKCITFEKMAVSPEVLKKVSYEIADKYTVMPLESGRGTLTIAISDPTDLEAIDKLSFILGVRIKPVLALESDIRKAIAKYYEGIPFGERFVKDRGKHRAEDVPLVQDDRGIPSPPSHERAAPNQQPAGMEEVPARIMVEALMEVLIEKGLITEEEIDRKLRERG